MRSREFSARWKEQCRKSVEPSECAAFRIAESLGEWVEHIDDKLEEHLSVEESAHERVQQLEADMRSLTESVDALKVSVAELVDVIAQARHAVQAYKWAIVVIGGVGAAVGWVMSHLTITPK